MRLALALLALLIAGCKEQPAPTPAPVAPPPPIVAPAPAPTPAPAAPQAPASGFVPAKPAPPHTAPPALSADQLIPAVMRAVLKKYPHAELREVYVRRDVVCGEARSSPTADWQRFYSTGVGMVWYNSRVAKVFKKECGE